MLLTSKIRQAQSVDMIDILAHLQIEDFVEGT